MNISNLRYTLKAIIFPMLRGLRYISKVLVLKDISSKDSNQMKKLKKVGIWYSGVSWFLGTVYTFVGI